jgi:mannosyl-3-phosphoglycerate phosphatase
MIVVFTDLDGTLLDAQSYDFSQAEPALDKLRSRRVPIVFCTSKTRAETELWRSRLQNRDPFVVENGGAAFIPRDYFGPVPTELRDGYEVLEFGARYSDLVRTLEQCSAESGIVVKGFYDMTAAELSEDAGLSLEQAELAKQREYDEPFRIASGVSGEALLRSITNRGLRCTRGGRYFHITGDNSKALAIVPLIERFRRQLGNDIVSVGVGDGLNDADFLNVVDVPILIPSVHLHDLRIAVPRGTVASAAGPAGWNSAILQVLSAAPT